jgi:hypothetical protein
MDFFLPCDTLTDWSRKMRWRVFTARYELGPYIKQKKIIVFKGLIRFLPRYGPAALLKNMQIYIPVNCE